MIRYYHPKDEADLRSCIHKLQEFESTINGLTAASEAMINPYLRELFRSNKESGGQIFVKDIKGHVVGFVAVQVGIPSDEIHEVKYDYAYISELVIMPAFRGIGYGKQLLEAAEQYARDHSTSILRIGSLALNHTARVMYQKSGFEEHAVLFQKILSCDAG